MRARKVDIIVVYKVDRLTRSLADFAKLVELFDQHSVSFVSITQSFNTLSKCISAPFISENGKPTRVWRTHITARSTLRQLSFAGCGRMITAHCRKSTPTLFIACMRQQG